MGSLRRLALPAGLAIAALSLAAPAQAYPQDPNNCNDSTITWNFDGSWNNYPTQKSWARSALGLWNRPLDYAGARLQTVSEVTSGGSVVVQLKDAPTNSYGSSECTFGASMWINRVHVGAASFVYQMSRHEMGHLLGMEHSGANDSWNGDNPPSMATCIDKSRFHATNLLSQDDQAYANWLHGVLANRQLHSNIGFEQGFGLWGRSAGTVEWQSSGGATGPGRIRHLTSSSTGYVYQTINIATGDDSGQPYRSVINYKVASAGHSGIIEGELFRQNITYPGDNTCAYADGLQDLNSPSYSTSGFVNVATTGPIGLAGKTAWTSGASVWEYPPSANGYRMQLRVYSHAKDSTGASQWVYLDNLRGEGT